MSSYVLAYTGGGMPETEEEQAAVMAAWGAWMGGLGDALPDGSLPENDAHQQNGEQSNGQK